MTLDPLHNLRLRVPRLLKLCLAQHLCFGEIYNHPGGPARKQEGLSSVRMALLRAFSAKSVHIGEKYQVSDLRANFAKKDRAVSPSSLVTKGRMRKMMRGENYYAADTVLLFAASLTDGVLGFVERCDVTRVSVTYTEILNKLLFNNDEAE